MRADLTGRPARLTLVAAVAALSLAATTAPALAADEPVAVGIGRAVTDQAERGTFGVTAWTDAPGATLVSVSAKVRRGDTVVAELPALAGAPGAEGRFTVPAGTPLKLTEDGGDIPALGAYAIDVTATDSTGATVTRRDAGTLDFTLRPVLVLPDLPKPTWQDPNARPQGTLVGIQPGSRDEVPLAGRTVSFDRVPAAGDTRTAVTTDTGAFASAPFPLATPSGEFRASFSEDSAEVHGSTAATRSVWQSQPRRVTVAASADRTRVLPGEGVTVSGRVLDGTDPLAGVVISVGLGRDGHRQGAGRNVTTDADGRFTATLTSVPGNGLNSWSAVPVDGWLSGDASGPLALPAESKMVAHSASLGADGRVVVSGAFSPKLQSNRVDGQDQQVQVEYSADGRTGWKALGSGWSSVSTPYNSWYNTFQVVGTGGASGSYRVRHLTSDQYAESVSQVFSMGRTTTRLPDVNATPEPVKKGAALAVTGTLQEYVNKSWRAMPKQKVQLWFRAANSSSFKLQLSTTTDAKGKAVFRTKATVDGSYLIRYFGDGTHFNSTATADAVDVR
ncbi:hypothetical protein ABT160_14850 [Streptomyces sp. NPDC001941]|uniref:hypothetical protein n=1 Tax=Streptomyces sp. NPDC001941 TaxID=3154659 RepID=UPI003328711D